MTFRAVSNNRQIFGGHEAVDYFGSITGWTDRGEKRAVKAITAHGTGGRVLDVGVGAGRTVALLAPLAGSYVGVDFAPAMVQRCRELHPGVDIRVGDARDLRDFADGSFDVVVFSYNGLDAVDHADRARALRELVRVLAPGGVLLFSTLNKDWPGRGHPPWRRARRGDSVRGDLSRTVRWLVHAPRQGPHYGRCCRNWWRNHRRAITEHYWAVDTLVVMHEYGLLVHFVSLAGLRRELADVGLVAEQILTDSGTVVEPWRERSEALYFHVVARRAGEKR